MSGLNFQLIRRLVDDIGWKGIREQCPNLWAQIRAAREVDRKASQDIQTEDYPTVQAK